MGALLYHHDRAAAAATDALLKVRGFKRNKSLEGWVTEARGDSIAVTFFGRSKDGENAAFYRVLVGADGTLMEKPSALKNPEPLSEFEADAAQARALALKSSFQPCAEKYNSVVLPVGDSREDWVIYLLPGTTNHRTVPIGGSYRINANIKNGEASVRPYTKTCVQLENDPRAVALMMTHLLDPQPTDIHVFWSTWARKPIYVSIHSNGTIWSIEGGSIRLIRRIEEKTEHAE